VHLADHGQTSGADGVTLGDQAAGSVGWQIALDAHHMVDEVGQALSGVGQPENAAFKTYCPTLEP